MQDLDKLMTEFEKKDKINHPDKLQKATRWLDEKGFQVLSGLAPIAKAVDVIATPVTEAVRAPLKYIAENVGENTSQTPPINTLAPYESWSPSDRIGLGLLAKDFNNAFGIKSAPLISEDTRKSIEAYAPKTADLVHQLSDPSEMAGLVAELVAGTGAARGSKVGGALDKVINPIPTVIEGAGNIPSVPRAIVEDVTNIGARLAGSPDPKSTATRVANNISGGLGELVHYPAEAGKYLYDRLANPRTVAANYIKATAQDKALLAATMRDGRFENIVDFVVQNPEMMNPLNRDKVLDLIEGPMEVDEANGKRARNYTKGQLGELAVQQGSIIDSLDNGATYDLEEIANTIANKAKGKTLSSQHGAIDELVNDIIDVTPVDQAKLARVAEAQRLQDVSDTLLGSIQSMQPNDPRLNRYLNKLMETYEALKEVEDPTTPNREAYFAFRQGQNTGNIQDINRARTEANRIMSSSHVGVDPLIANARTNATAEMGKTLSDIVKSSIGDESIGWLYDETNKGIAARKGFQELNRGARVEGANVPEFNPRGMGDFISATGAPLTNAANQWTRRQGVRYNNAMTGAVMTPVSIQQYKIPREFVEILNQEEEVFKKLMEEMGDDVAQDFLQLKDNPIGLKNFIRQIEAIRPDILAFDELGRLNGEIADPELKKKAMTSLFLDNQMPAYDKALKIQDLITQGRFV